jgi:hypothetical protein
MHDFLGFFLFFAALAFGITQFEKSIARRTADEIERRSKPPAPAKPWPRPPWWAWLICLAMIGLFLGVVVSWGFVEVVAVVILAAGAPMMLLPLLLRPRPSATAQVSTGPTAQPAAGSPSPRPE